MGGTSRTSSLRTLKFSPLEMSRELIRVLAETPLLDTSVLTLRSTTQPTSSSAMSESRTAQKASRLRSPGALLTNFVAKNVRRPFHAGQSF